MMDKLNRFIQKTTRLLGEISGWTLCACMLMVTGNVLLRAIFSKPILGTYEWVGFLTAVSLSLGLPYCASVGGHIAVDFIVERFRPPVQRILSVVIGGISAVLMSAVAVSLFIHAMKLMSSGEVSPTTKVPFYLFVLVGAVSFVWLTLVLAVGVGTTITGSGRKSR